MQEEDPESSIIATHISLYDYERENHQNTITLHQKQDMKRWKTI